jgi:CubicO group peptidase (beta-lactamase class C family)
MSSKCILQLVFLGFVFILISSCEKAVIRHDIDVEIEQLVQSYNLPSLSACVIRNHEIVWSQTYGYGDIENQIEATDETIYHVGSISKLFIVSAIMQLEEQGMLDIDRDINHYLPIVFRHPTYPDVPITARMLLTHTAGLAWPQSYDGEQGMWTDYEADQAPPPSEWVPEFLVPTGRHYDASLWKEIRPGAYELYSNIGACVIAYLVEEISGKNFRTYCKDHIFEPLNMLSTSYNYADLHLDRIAKLYRSAHIYRTSFDNRVYAAGGLKTTIRDLSNFAIAYMNNGILNNVSILQESTIERILEIQNEASGRCLIWQALLGGWFTHTGGLEMGAATVIEIHPKDKIALIIFTNSHSSIVLPGNEIHGLVRQKANEFR